MTRPLAEPASHPRSAQPLADLIALCDPATGPEDRAAGLLGGMDVVAPHAAAAVSFVDPRTGRHRLLANHGYAPPVLDYLLDGFVAADRGWRRVRTDPDAVLCWHDVPGYAQSYGAREVFGTEGYAEGTSVCLLDADRRIVGAVHVSVREPELPEATRTAVLALRRTFATLAKASAARAAVTLSARERQILRGLARGQPNAEIAAELVVSRRTVATHVEHILAKLGARNRADAAVRGVRLGLL